MLGTVHQAENQVYVLNVPENSVSVLSMPNTVGIPWTSGEQKKNEWSKPSFLILHVYVILKIKSIAKINRYV